MIRHEQYQINGKPVVYCQAETLEEAGKFTPGQHFYWEYDGQRYDQGGLMQKVIEWSRAGIFTPTTMLAANKVQPIYQQMIDTQKKSMLSALNTMRAHISSLGAETKEIDKTIEAIGTLGFPGLDGIHRPTIEEMQFMAGGKAALDAILSAREQMELAGVLRGN